MSLPPAEERKLQHTKIDELAYIAWLLEQVCWMLSNQTREAVLYHADLKEQYDASRKQGTAAVYGHLRAQPPARAGNVPEYDPPTAA